MPAMVATELREGLIGFLGAPISDSLADAHLRNSLFAAKAYTRGEGFDERGRPSEDLAAVVISAAARSASNPTGVRNESIGSRSVTPGTFQGWTLAELAILHRYRKRAH